MIVSIGFEACRLAAFSGNLTTMRLRHIEVFNAVMLTGSVTAAARMINVTQPAVSRTLKHAELRLGFPLFHRVGGRLRPTAEAQALYPRVESLFVQLDEIQRLASGLRSGEGEGQLRVLTVLALSYDVMPRAMVLFRERHPKMLVHHESLHSPDIVKSLVLQQADVGFVFSSVTHPTLEQDFLGKRRVVCVAPKGFFTKRELAAGRISLRQLAGRPAIGLDNRDPLAITLGQILHDNEIAFDLIMTVQTYHAAIAMAHYGLGMALVESFTAAAVNPALADVLPVEPEIKTSIHALRPSAGVKLLAAKDFTLCFQKALEQLA
ncbi:MAG: LysR substrate-binding domain-containing protein [Quisquiliibacterium sp.]